jgi:hypothetical protein
LGEILKGPKPGQHVAGRLAHPPQHGLTHGREPGFDDPRVTRRVSTDPPYGKRANPGPGAFRWDKAVDDPRTPRARHMQKPPRVGAWGAPGEVLRAQAARQGAHDG